MTRPDEDEEHDCRWKRYAAFQDAKLEKVTDTLAAVQAKLALLERQMFGKKSERAPKSVKLPPPAAPDKPTPAETKALRQARKKALEDAVLVEVVPLSVPPEDKRCPSCSGTELRKVGDKPSVVMDFVKAHFRKRIYQRETLACACGGMVSAEPPERVFDKTHYAAGFCAQVVVSKLRDHMPLYRMAKAFESQGIPIARSTLNGLLHRTAAELLPIYNAALALVPNAHRVLADETTFRQQNSSAKTYLWSFVTDDIVLYRYATSRSGETPKDVLKDSKGLLTADQHSGYNAVSAPGSRIRGGCLAHARRRIFEARALSETKEPLAWIRDLYLVERRAMKDDILHSPEHLALRKRESRPLFAKLLIWARKHRRLTEPRSLLGRAAGYIVRHFRDLGRFLRHAELRLDNNRAEAALRPVALGRKNYLFVGTEDAGKHIAALYTLVATCELHKVDPHEYITDVLRRVQSHPAADVADLLPNRWKLMMRPPDS